MTKTDAMTETALKLTALADMLARDETATAAAMQREDLGRMGTIADILRKIGVYIQNAEDVLTKVELDKSISMARIETLQGLVLEAADTFEHYAELHGAKGTPDGDLKATRNQEFANKLRAGLASSSETRLGAD